MTKNTLGLDLGTNSIGWAVIQSDSDTSPATGCPADCAPRAILAAGSRVIPNDAATLGDFAKGNPVSQTKDRTLYRGMRRMRQRFLLRRQRLLRVLTIMGALPGHYQAHVSPAGELASERVKLAWADGDDGQRRFLFMPAFREMLAQFQAAGNAGTPNYGHRLPYDWTVYYLRHKALTQPVTLQELAWILLQFNQKRGYSQLRGEDDDTTTDPTKREEYKRLTITSVADTGEKDKKGAVWYDIHLSDGNIYRRSCATPPQWQDQQRDFIITTRLDSDGQVKKKKDGSADISIRMPSDDDWGLQKVKAEADINGCGATIGSYIYRRLLTHPEQKIIGQTVRVVDRHFYRDELRLILSAQKRFLPQLSDAKLYADCLQALYPNNPGHASTLASADFTRLLADDILFYQRPLKSKKSLIDDCPLETRRYTDAATGQTVVKPVKCAPKSHPVFQQFRLWQFVSNLRILQRAVPGDGGRELTGQDVTSRYLPDGEARAKLFDHLNGQATISQDTLLKHLGIKKAKGSRQLPCRWNYDEDKEFPGNTTRADILSALGKAGVTSFELTPGREEALWHILYSVQAKAELRQAMRTFARKNGLPEDAFAESLATIKPYDSAYAAYSLKALRKLTAVMRDGHHWQWHDIDPHTRQRIAALLSGEADDSISTTHQQLGGLDSESQFSGLSKTQASYLVYGRHSEAADTTRWQSPDDIDTWLASFRQHSLRNPIVEQVVTETMRTVRDIWRRAGHIDEIHLELGRDMRNPADKRRQTAKANSDNERANIRVKALLQELAMPDAGVAGVRPYSPSQQELLRIYEQTALDTCNPQALKAFDDANLDDVRKKLSEADPRKRPSHSDVMRYKCWLEQQYRSPYTGQPIPLARLFTPDYEIEHIIPQSRFFDDSFSNKVICEAAVNKLKGNLLGHEFIARHSGATVDTGRGVTVRILTLQDYERHVADTYRNSHAKRRKLLMDDIPEEFVQRQLNDTRYISRYVISLLSRIVRQDGEQEACAKRLVVCQGAVTDRLKKDWGINDVWNRIILPRFERLNTLCPGKYTAPFTARTQSGHTIPSMPLELQAGFNKKRIDHRHHAMDAIVIACATRDIVNYLNNAAAHPEATPEAKAALRRDLKHKLCQKVRQDASGSCSWVVRAPWPAFQADVNAALDRVIVSFKQKTRILTPTQNRYDTIQDGHKTTALQTAGEHRAIRKALHKDTVFGLVSLQLTKEVRLAQALQHPDRIADRQLRAQIGRMLSQGLDEATIKKRLRDSGANNTGKITIRYFSTETGDKQYYATRKAIDTSFDKKKIGQITDTGIRQIMLRHLDNSGGDPEQAFSPEGIEAMNRNIRQLNLGRWHQPIRKVRWCEASDKFAVGQNGQKAAKYVEAAKGTNLFFAVYQDSATAQRRYATIPLSQAIACLKRHQPITAADGITPAFLLSPGQLVYLPLPGQTDFSPECIDRSRIYKMVSCSADTAKFIQHNIAAPILRGIEFNTDNKLIIAVTGEKIQQTCLPLQLDRLGRITHIGL